MSLDDPNYPTDPATILNGDAHIRSSFSGRVKVLFYMKESLKLVL